MKISKQIKQQVKAASAAPVVADATSDSTELNDMIYSDAIKNIKSAIDTLGAYARRTGDQKAKDAIADLGVVLFELKA